MSKSMSFCIQYDISIGSFQLNVSVLHLCCGTFCIPWNVKLQICVKCQLTWVVRIIFYDIVPCYRLLMETTLIFNPTQDLSRKLVNLSFWSFDLIRIFYVYGNIIIVNTRTSTAKTIFRFMLLTFQFDLSESIHKSSWHYKMKQKRNVNDRVKPLKY